MNDISEEAKALELFHFGVKGMKWGVRKSQNSDSSSSNSGESNKTPRKPMSREKKLAIAASAGAVVLGIATTAVILKTNGKLDISKLPKPSKKAQDTVKNLVDDKTELKSLMWATRGKDLGARVLRSGGISDPMVEMERAGFDDMAINVISKYGDRMEKVTANIIDPEGRTDRAGRLISHNFNIPEDLAKDINTLDDVKTKIWPMVSQEYDKFYKDSFKY